MHSTAPRRLISVGLALALFALTLLISGDGPALQAAPAGQGGNGVVVVIEEPQAGQTVSGQVLVRGWAIDTRATNGPGVQPTDGVQVWLDRGGRSPVGVLLGTSVYGGDRPEVAQRFGAPFRQSGFLFQWDSCLVRTGQHTLQVFAESIATGGVDFGSEVDVNVEACPATARPAEVVGRQPLRTSPVWQDVLNRTVELRGLAPLRDVYRAPLTRETFDARFEAQFASYYQSRNVDTSRLMLQAFGLLDPGLNLPDELRRLNTNLPLGIFDVDNDVLYVQRDPPESPLARVTMAHEITHALQHQHYDLQRLLPTGGSDQPDARPRDPDQTMAIRALVEGDAVLAQRMYQATTIRDPAEQQRLAQEEDQSSSAVDFARLPYAVTESTYFPYIYGPQFIYGVLGDGPLTSYGQYGPAIEALFRRLPNSTSQILHPERYQARTEPVAVPMPDLTPVLAGDWNSLGDGPLGELSHRLILANWLRDTDPNLAVDASSGWTGDRAAVYLRGEADVTQVRDLAVVLKTRWASPQAAEDWARAYAQTVPLLYSHLAAPRGAGDDLQAFELSPTRLAWELPLERGIALAWQGQFSVIAIAPDANLARQLAEFALGGQ